MTEGQALHAALQDTVRANKSGGATTAPELADQRLHVQSDRFIASEDVPGFWRYMAW